MFFIIYKKKTFHDVTVNIFLFFLFYTIITSDNGDMISSKLTGEQNSSSHGTL